jgi:RNA polymerase sigma-70 factor (ECF subfamily)
VATNPGKRAIPVGPEGWEGLAIRIQQGDASAAESLAESMFAPLSNYARRSLGDPQSSDDVAQETIIRVIKNIHKYQAGTRFRAWVYRIALNLCRNKATRKRHISYEGIPENAMAALPKRPDKVGPVDAATQNDEVRRVREALAQLSEPFQEIVHLRLYQGLSFREISEALDVPEGTLKSRMHHAVRHLRTILGFDPKVPKVGSDSEVIEKR